MDRLTAAKVFVDVAYSGSFTATADRLNMSRPMVTRYIEAMEEWLSVRLLHRTTRKVTLTSAGEASLTKVERWLDEAESLLAVTRQGAELSGMIRVSTSMSFGFSKLVPAIRRFMEQHPLVTIDIVVDDTVTNPAEQQIDLSIRIASNPDSALIGKPIGVCQSVLVASPDYIKQHASIEHPQDLLQHDCLGYKHFERHIWHLNREESYQAVDINPRLSANEATVLQHAAMAGMGIAIQPMYLVEGALADGRLVHVLPDWKPNDLTIYALYSSRKYLAPATRAFIDHLTLCFEHQQRQ